MSDHMAAKLPNFLADLSKAGSRPVFLPDIGTFFNQDEKLAMDMVRELAAAGCRFVKGEVLHDAQICLRDAPNETWLDDAGNKQQEPLYDLIRRKTNSLAFYGRMVAACHDAGCGVVMSVYDHRAVDFCVESGVDALKIASSNISHLPLIDYATRSGLPVIIDTGKAQMVEIANAIGLAKGNNPAALIIEHSPAAPPSPVSDHNLRMMVALGQQFDLPFGLSDHHAGEEMMVAAVALGAQVIETGICPDDLPADQDRFHATRISRVASLVQELENVAMALGKPSRMLPDDWQPPHNRMGILAGRDLSAGHVLDVGDLTYAFPVRDIGAENWMSVIGRRLAVPVKQGAVLRWCDFEPVAGEA